MNLHMLPLQNITHAITRGGCDRLSTVRRYQTAL